MGDGVITLVLERKDPALACNGLMAIIL
jgi:hypothetical protein